MLETALMGFLGLVLGALAGTILHILVRQRTACTMPGMEEMAAQFNLPARIIPECEHPDGVAGPLVVVFMFTLLAAVYPALAVARLQTRRSDEDELMRMPVLYSVVSRGATCGAITGARSSCSAPSRWARGP